MKIDHYTSFATVQEYQPDLVLADFVMMGGAALADKLNIPKAMMVIPGLLPPQMPFDYGSGSHLLATVPQFQSLLPRRMVKPSLAPDVSCACDNPQHLS